MKWRCLFVILVVSLIAVAFNWDKWTALANQENPKDLYVKAFNFLSVPDFRAAETFFLEFIERYPDHHLGGNAHFWLGEVYRVTGDFERAAITYQSGWKRYPNGAKAPDSLLQLGMVLINLGNVTEGCAIFAKLSTQYPNAARVIIVRSTQEWRRSGCAHAAPATREPKSKDLLPRVVSSGSGFFVSPEGFVLTNYHVIKECHEVRISPNTQAKVIASDIEVDLALLQGRAGERRFARFRAGRSIRPGDSVVGMGYPLQGILTSDLNITTGIVSALAGPGDDRRFIQISAPVQPGNSGGPLLDRSGNVVGIIVGKLDAIKVARATGDIPQNVNFAISALAARAFLDAQGINYETAPSKVERPVADIATEGRGYTVLIECWG